MKVLTHLLWEGPVLKNQHSNFGLNINFWCQWEIHKYFIHEANSALNWRLCFHILHICLSFSFSLPVFLLLLKIVSKFYDFWLFVYLNFIYTFTFLVKFEYLFLPYLLFISLAKIGFCKALNSWSKCHWIFLIH